MDTKQHFFIPLAAIVPEYASRNPVVRWLFAKRLAVARAYVQQGGTKALLDAGCGDGSFFAALAAVGIHPESAWGIDMNPGVIALQERFPAVHFAVQDLSHMAFPDQTFDTIVSLDVLEHIEQVADVLAECKRVLLPGGILITSEPVESVLYKSLRYVLKGTYSQESGPGAGVHYHNAAGIHRAVLAAGFRCLDARQIPLPPPFDLFHVNRYQLCP